MGLCKEISWKLPFNVDLHEISCVIIITTHLEPVADPGFPGQGRQLLSLELKPIIQARILPKTA